MIVEQRVGYPGVQAYDKNGNVIGNYISKGGGEVNLATGLVDPEGFFVTIAPSGAEGLLKVVLYSDTTETPVVLPFYKGWEKNPILLKKIVVDAGNTATAVYWGK